MTQAWLNRIGTAVPPHDIHTEFVDFARSNALDPRSSALFERMAALAEIDHRFSILQPAPDPANGELDSSGFYRPGDFPSTGERMTRFQPAALGLAMQAVGALDLGARLAGVTHLIVASCTGFTAPGLDFQIMREAGLPDSVERTSVGFMGCFAAVNALKLARHIVRSEPHAQVLVVTVELCTLHLQASWTLEKLLSFLLFGDGAAAALVTAEPGGLALDRFRAAVVDNSEQLITWDIRDSGFDMHLSGQVPGRIRRWLGANGPSLLGNHTVEQVAFWAVHAGGRSILDAVQTGLGLNREALRFSREILRSFGNMSSSTLLFVLDRVLRERRPGQGMAMAFGPGLSVESFGFHCA